MSKNTAKAKVELSDFLLRLMKEQGLSFDELMYIVSSELCSLTSTNLKD